MNGPEHYHAAELLLAEAGEQPGEASARSIATAQVHATLALVAATALHGGHRPPALVRGHGHPAHRRLAAPGTLNWSPVANDFPSPGGHGAPQI